MKQLLYRFAIWLEYRALDLQDWAAPEIMPLSYEEVLVGAIDSDADFFEEVAQGNALLRKLTEQADEIRNS